VFPFRQSVFFVVHFKGFSERKVRVKLANGWHQALETRVHSRRISIGRHLPMFFDQSLKMSKRVSTGLLKRIEDKRMLQHGFHPVYGASMEDDKV
jgi:hypothetical protein